MFIRADRLKRPLQTPYDGLYRVLKRSKKWFRNQMGEKEDSVSIDRLKPAFFLKEDIKPHNAVEGSGS